MGCMVDPASTQGILVTHLVIEFSLGSVKARRLAICFNAASTSAALDSFIRGDMFRPLVYLNWSGPESVEIGYLLRSWDKSSRG